MNLKNLRDQPFNKLNDERLLYDNSNIKFTFMPNIYVFDENENENSIGETHINSIDENISILSEYKIR